MSSLAAPALAIALVLAQDVSLDRQFIRDTAAGVADAVDREYFDPVVAARVRALLKERAGEGRYDADNTPDALARHLTRELVDDTGDKHLAVGVIRASALPGSPAAARPEESREALARRANGGVRRVEVLAGNVGYLDLNTFFRLNEARDSVVQAMATLKDTPALIIDMRGNGGGSPETVALLASYLFDEPGLALFAIHPRSGEPNRYATETPAVLHRNGTRPVYVLTSARTFSAGEGFAFLVQDRRRGEVIGEATAGAANPGRPYPVNERFNVTVPNGRVRMAVGGGNWEGRGVTPDVIVPEAEALGAALARARAALKTPR